MYNYVLTLLLLCIQNLLDEMKELCGVPTKLHVKTLKVSLAQNSDGFELIPESDPRLDGYFVKPLCEDKFKVTFT